MYNYCMQIKHAQKRIAN